MSVNGKEYGEKSEHSNSRNSRSLRQLDRTTWVEIDTNLDGMLNRECGTVQLSTLSWAVNMQRCVCQPLLSARRSSINKRMMSATSMGLSMYASRFG